MPTEEHAKDLPEGLVLPLQTGAPWWYWLGGRPSLDFVNTLRERWRRRVETLTSTEDLSQWLVSAGLMPERRRVTRDVLEQARELREAIDALLVASLEGRPAPRAAIAVVDHGLVRSGIRPQLVRGADGAPVLTERGPADSPLRALGTIALDAATMLGTPEERARIRICASDTCSARFYDRSPAGRRVWCSMRTCGNEAKARRHRARQKAGVAAQ